MYLLSVFYGAIGAFKKSFVRNICSLHLGIQLFSHFRKIFENSNNSPPLPEFAKKEKP